MFTAIRRSILAAVNSSNWRCSQRCGELMDDLRKRLRQLPFSRRIAFLVLLILLLFYVLMAFFNTSTKPSFSNGCVEDRLRSWRDLEDYSAEASVSTTQNKNVILLGNGFIGLGGDGELRIRTNTSRVLSIPTAFYPLVDAHLSSSSSYPSRSTASVFDYRNAQLKRFECYSVNADECACITTTVYVHRTRPHLLVQDVQITNPTDESFKVAFSRQREPKDWNAGEKVGETHTWWRLADSNGDSLLLAAVCSIVPDGETLERKREENTRFTCLFNYEYIEKEKVANKDQKQQEISHQIVKEFADTMHVKAAELDEEHTSAWHTLNSISFGISKSLAPDALNPISINATRYALLSNSRAPLLEHGISEQYKREMIALAQRKNMCYTGHSTLLVPSRLWKVPKSVRGLIDTVDIWLLTLEKRGCASLLKAGASGVAEAFALSLFASKFSGEHLEVDMDPTDLHREMTIENLSFSSDTKLSIAVRLDDENRPFFSLSSTSKMFVCDAACLNRPLALESTWVRIPVKITRPSTPILYLSKSRHHLEQMRGTIHVIEVLEAPAHEQELIALHKHGHRLGGLPVIFWVMLGLLVLVFHLFLVKLLYSEWKKNDSTPYNYYLRQRYMRMH